MEDDITEKIYPRLNKRTEPSAPENTYTNIESSNSNSSNSNSSNSNSSNSNSNSSNYRLEHIKQIRNYLEKDSDIRRALSKKYSKISTGLNYTNYCLNGISAASGIVSVSTLPTITLIPLSIILGGISIATSSLSILSSKLNKKFKNKESKHRDIYNLSENKLSLINSLISKALEDGQISTNEFDIILKEEKHYRLHKEDIRRKNKTLDEEKIKNELKESLLEPINNLVNVINKKIKII